MAEQKKQDVNQLLKVRRDKLADLQANGRDPFQITKFDQTHHSLEVKNLYEAHEAELLKDRKELDVTGLDEEQAKEAQKKDYEERRSIMDASPIHVSIAGRMMFKRVMGKASFCNIQDLQGNIQVYVARDAIGTDSYLLIISVAAGFGDGNIILIQNDDRRLFEVDFQHPGQ